MLRRLRSRDVSSRQTASSVLYQTTLSVTTSVRRTVLVLDGLRLLRRWDEGRVAVGDVLLRRVDGRLGGESTSGDVDLVAGVLHHKVVRLLQQRTVAVRVQVADEAEADHAAQGEAEAAGGGEAGKPAIAVDGFPSPRPHIQIDIVVLQLEVNKTLFDAMVPLPLQR